MTTLSVEAVAESTTARGFWTRSRKAGTAYVLIGLLAAAGFGALTPAGTSARFAFTPGDDGLALSLPATAAAVVFGLLCVVVGGLLLGGLGKHHFGWTTAVALTALLLSFLCWQVAGKSMPVFDTVDGTLRVSLPLILGALAGVMCERAGVINVAIEGHFLVGAFAGAFVGTLAASMWIGLLAAAVAGCLLALLLAVLAIRYLVDQVVLGVVLNVFALGLTGVLYESLMQQHPERYNHPDIFPEWTIPGLSQIPLIGPAVFQANIFVYLALAMVVVVNVALFRTRWGLRVRAVGEHPTAADTVGIRVRLVRYRNVIYGGLLAGIGGAFFTIGNVGAFSKNMTSGKGFIALAALIFGRWSPTGAFAAALLFGFADKLQEFLGSIGSPIPSQFLIMAPYLATILAVAGLVGKVRAPAADGRPY